MLYAVGNVLAKAGGPLVQQAESPDLLLRPGGALYVGRSPDDACIAPTQFGGRSDGDSIGLRSET